MKKVENPLVSVIVPIYKVEAYLNQCVESIVKQSYSHLEILLMDDGSPDGCPAICDSWAKRDARIRVVHKANEGLSGTRNRGISLASGDYLLMPDGDDYLAPDTIEVMVRYALAYQAQCVLGGYRKAYPNGTFVEHGGTDTVFPCGSGREIQEHILLRLIGAEYRGMPHLSQPSCMKLYDRRFILENALVFQPTQEIGMEDFLFNIQFFEKAERAVIIPENNYYYRANNCSITTTFNPERANCLIRLYQRLEREPVLTDSTAYCQMLSANILGGISVHIKQIVAFDMPEKLRQIGLLMEEPTVRKMLAQCRIWKIKFPLSLFCFLMRHKMKYTLYFLIQLFLVVS